MKFTTIVSGFHRVRPVIKLADGTLLIGDQAEGSTADYHQYDISFSELKQLGWGVPASTSTIDRKAVMEINFVFPKDQSFDIWIDDISFAK